MTILDSLKKLNKVEGVTDESANTILEALKALYAKKGGTNSTSNTIAEAIDEVSTVAGGGGGGGSSDFSTAEVTFTVSTGSFNVETITKISVIGEDDELTTDMVCEDGDSVFNKVVLYKGNGYGYYSGSGTVSVTGDITYDEGDIYITGNGTITIS